MNIELMLTDQLLPVPLVICILVLPSALYFHTRGCSRIYLFNVLHLCCWSASFMYLLESDNYFVFFVSVGYFFTFQQSPIKLLVSESILHHS